MGKQYSKEEKLKAVELFEEGKSHREITEALGIRDAWRTKKWMRAYREKGEAAFEKASRKGKGGRPPKKTNPQAYVARLEMEVALLKKFHMVYSLVSCVLTRKSHLSFSPSLVSQVLKRNTLILVDSGAAQFAGHPSYRSFKLPTAAIQRKTAGSAFETVKGLFPISFILLPFPLMI